MQICLLNQSLKNPHFCNIQNVPHSDVVFRFALVCIWYVWLLVVFWSLAESLSALSACSPLWRSLLVVSLRMCNCEQYITATTRDWSVGSPKKWIIFIIILFVFNFMQCIYNYIPETNRVSRIYSFAAILYLQFMVHVMLFPMLNVLYFYISTFRSVCAVPRMGGVFFFFVPWFHAYPVYCSGTVWVILSWFQLSLLLLVYYYHNYFHISWRQRCEWKCWNNFFCCQGIKEWTRFSYYNAQADLPLKQK